MPHPETSHCLSDELIREFVDETPKDIPSPGEAAGLTIGENLILVFRDQDAPATVVVETRPNPAEGSPADGKVSSRLFCRNRPDKVRRNVLLACEQAFTQSLRNRMEGRSFCNSEPDAAFAPSTFVMTKLTPGQEPPPEATSILNTFTDMDFGGMALDQYQVMGLGRYRMGVRRDLDRPRWFVVQLVDSHGDRILEEVKMPEPQLRDTMRRTADRAMTLTVEDAT